VRGAPWKFFWRERSDRDGLKAYIDAQLAGRKSEAVQIEQTGLVTGVQMFPQPHGDEATVNVKADALFQTLMLRDTVELPLWGRVRFCTNHDRLVPADFIASLAAVADPEGRFLDPTKGPWRIATVKDLDAMGLKPEDVTSGMYRHEVEPVHAEGAAEAEDAPPGPIAETEVQRIEGRRTLTLVTKCHAKKPYFSKRIYSVQDGALVYSGTAWSPQGPWTDYHRDNGRFMALGVGP
jgi:hypothetical protein